MKIKSESVEVLKKNIAEYQKHEEYELECKIKYCTNSEMISHELEKKYKKYSDLPKIYFDRAMKYLLTLNLPQNFGDESLDINTEEYRITIGNLEEIMKYINTNSWDSQSKNITVIERKKNKNRFDFPGFNLVFDLKQESPVNDTSKISHYIESQLKDFRLKKRWTFFESDWKYDLTMVKTSKQSNTFKKSDCLRNQNTYEVEIEFIGKTGNTSEKYLKSCLLLYAVMYGEFNLITSEEKILVAQEFYQIKQEMFRIDSNACPAVFKKTLRHKFRDTDLINIMVGPKPITLEKTHLIKRNFGITSLLEDYTVTPKADGERCLLWINSGGKVYIIDSSSTIKWTGITTNGQKCTLVDGELITGKKDKKYLNLYAIFDIYIYNNEYTANCPLISKNNENSRDKYCNEFFKKNDKMFSNIGLTLHKKEFLYGPDLLNQCDLILNRKDSYPFTIDGLIFTPKYFGVNCYFLEDKAKMQQNTWNLLYKWKPPEENTIDFLIEFDSSLIDVGRENKAQNFQLINLSVADKKSKHIYPLMWMKLTANSNFPEVKKLIITQLDAETTPKLFQPDSNKNISQTRVPIDENGKIIINNGQELVNDTIVEFYWDSTWIPLRNREIKTQIYQANKLRGVRSFINNTANYWDTAVSIWNSIKNPVTEGMIRGKDNIEYSENLEQYYSQIIPRDKRAGAEMTRYHNLIKTQLITCVQGTEGVKSLMDIACGKGGDFYKWCEAKFTKIFGIDLIRDNIENVSDGAYTRTAKAFAGTDLPNNAKRVINYSECSCIYLTLDASKKIDNDYINGLEDENDREAAKILYKLSKPEQPDIRMKYWGYAITPFKVVSCQFAIHYFFETSQTLDNFISNVDRHLDNSGYFIGTCLDGKLVKKLLKKEAFQQWISGSYNSRTIWAIQKLYESDSETFDFGEKISVYMESINNEKIEYLVNLDLLTDRLKKHNILRLNKSECEELDITDSIRNFRDFTSRTVLKPEEKQYSYLNTTFVFKKIAKSEQ